MSDNVLAALPQTITPSGTFVTIRSKHNHSIIQEVVISLTNVSELLVVSCTSDHMCAHFFVNVVVWFPCAFAHVCEVASNHAGRVWGDTVVCCMQQRTS